MCVHKTGVHVFPTAARNMLAKCGLANHSFASVIDTRVTALTCVLLGQIFDHPGACAADALRLANTLGQSSKRPLVKSDWSQACFANTSPA